MKQLTTYIDLKKLLLPQSLLLLTMLTGMIVGISSPVYAANECRIEYGYHTGSGLSRKDHVRKVSISQNRTKTINRSKMNYVKNLKTNQVKVFLTGAVDVTLDRNAINPPVAFYLTPVKMDKVKCLAAQTNQFDAPQALITAFKQSQKSVTQIAKGLKDTFNLNGQKVAELLKVANFSAEDIAKAIKSSFNASVTTVARWLKAAGFTPVQVVTGLKNGLRAKVSEVLSAIKSVFGTAGNEATKLLKNAGFPVDDIAKALKSVYRATPTKIAGWLKAAGYSIEQIVAAFKSGLNSSAADMAKLLKDMGVTRENAEQILKKAKYRKSEIADVLNQFWGDLALATRNTARVIANPTNAGVKIDCVRLVSEHCRTPDRRSPPQIQLQIAYHSNVTSFDIYGANLQGVTEIRGLQGASLKIERQSHKFMRVKVTTRYKGSNWQGPTSGTGRLYADGRAVKGGEFKWTYYIHKTQQVAHRPSGVGITNSGGRNNNQTTNNQSGNSQSNTGRNQATNSTSLPDLVPVKLIDHWKLGPSVTLMDSRGGRYVYHTVNSSFCRTGMREFNSSSVEGSGLTGVYYRRSFTLPAVIGVEVKNQGSAASGRTNVQLKNARKANKQSALPAIQPNRSLIVGVARPANYKRKKCVIRGGGLSVTGCYACRLDSTQDGDLTVEVDTNNAVNESNESNNLVVFR